jgi:hypothetical protein
MATFSAFRSSFSPAGAAPDVRAAGRRRDLVELAVGYGLILMVIWTPRPWQRWFYIAALLWIVAASCFSFDGWKVMGLAVGRAGAGRWVRSLWVVGAALLVAVIAVLVATWMGTLNRPLGGGLFVRTFWGYAIWSFMQQLLLQDFVLLRLLRLMPGKRAAVLVAAGLFALAHLPGPILTAVTLMWGAAACWLFLIYRNVYALGIAHAILGVCMAIVVPGRVDHNMRVGLGYLRYHPHPHPRVHVPGGRGQRSQSDHNVSTDEWVIADDPMRRS